MPAYTRKSNLLFRHIKTHAKSNYSVDLNVASLLEMRARFRFSSEYLQKKNHITATLHHPS